jgi:hypothetical protein
MADEQWVPGSKAELMSAIEREWALLMDLAGKLESGQMAATDAGGWSAKDNLAHLAEWMKILMGFYMDLRRAHEVLGAAPEVTQVWDFEARNDFLFERNRHRSEKEVMDELQQVYAELTARLNTLSFDDLMKPQHPFDPARRPLLLYVLRGTSRHFAEHRERIEKNLAGSEQAG